jgi:hypothetical protein
MISKGFTRLRPMQGNTVKIAEAFKTREAFRHGSAEEPARLDLMSIPECTRRSPSLWIRRDRPIVAAGLVPVWRGQGVSHRPGETLPRRPDRRGPVWRGQGVSCRSRGPELWRTHQKRGLQRISPEVFT